MSTVCFAHIWINPWLLLWVDLARPDIACFDCANIYLILKDPYKKPFNLINHVIKCCKYLMYHLPYAIFSIILFSCESSKL